MIHIIRTRATPEQIAEMLPVFEFFIKLAVDIERKFLREAARATPIARKFCWRMAVNKKISGAQIGIRIAQKSSLKR